MNIINDIGVLVNAVLSLAGVAITITGAIAGISKLIKSINKRKNDEIDNINTTVKSHTQEIRDLKNDMIQVKADTKENNEMTKLIFKGVKSLMDNSISGNGIENLKKTRKELDDFLLEKK